MRGVGVGVGGIGWSGVGECLPFQRSQYTIKQVPLGHVCSVKIYSQGSEQKRKSRKSLGIYKNSICNKTSISNQSKNCIKKGYLFGKNKFISLLDI